MTQREHDSTDRPETLFAPASLWQAWLDVEVALAQAQAELGIIPDWAADGIAKVADVETLGLDALEAELRAVAPADAVARMRREADDVVTLQAPDDFAGAVGAYYRDFRQVTDDEVVRALAEAAGVAP